MSSNNDTPPATAVDTTPLLDDADRQITPTRPRFLRRPPSLRGAARFLRSASSRTLSLREPSVRVRESANEQIEERQNDWAYSKPIVILDLVWNLAFVIVTISVLIMSRRESPSLSLRLWIVGYALMCVLHMVCLCVEYRRRYLIRNLNGDDGGRFRYSRNNSNSSSGSEDAYTGGDYVSESQQSGGGGDDDGSVAKHLESANTMFSFIWWIIGFYWVSAGGQTLTSEAPQLYWLCITFLAFDVFFVVICVAAACVIGIAVCCCLPCIIALLYAVADQEGANKEDIDKLPKYKFQKLGNFEKESGEIQVSFGGIMVECDAASPSEHVLPLEDAECCICLCAYDDGAELRELPCRHHFHASCIDKWLHINATCPLCKFNILKNGDASGSEEA